MPTRARAGRETFHHRFEKVKGGHAEHPRTAVLAIDCQEFCRPSSELMERECPLVATACLACADACKARAAGCVKHDDPHMKECADACHACEKVCRGMAKETTDPEVDAARKGATR